MKILIKQFSFTLLLFFFVFRANAQTILPVPGSDTYFYTYSGLTHLSADVISTPQVGGSTGHLWAIGYGAGSSFGMIARHSNGYADTFTHTGATDGDIALGDDMNYTLGLRHFMIYCYTSVTGGVRYANVARVQIRNVGLPSMFFNGTGGARLSSTAGSNPRVDFFADTVTKINSQTPSLHKFGCTWGEDDDSIHLALGESSSSINTLVKYAFIFADTVRNADIAGQFLIDSNQSVAHIGFTRDTIGGCYIYHAEINCSGTPYIKKVELLGYESGRISELRIEAMTLYKTAQGGAQWAMVYKRPNNSIVHYNSLSMTGTVLNEYGGLGYSPCIAAGSGLPSPSVATKAGNSHYATGWINDCGNVLSQNVSTSTGLRPLSGFFYDWNSNTAVQRLNMSTTANTGNRTMAVWYDGADIWYKMLDTIPSTDSVPSWTATTPSLADRSLWYANTPGRIDWVNTERHNLYLTNNNTAQGYIQAVANDFYDSTLGTYKVVINAYSSITNTVRTFTVYNARHPDVAIFDDWADSIAVVDTPNYHLYYAYEDVSTSPTQIRARMYDLNNPFDDTKFSLIPYHNSAFLVSSSSNAQSCPHIESSPHENPNHFPVPEIYPMAVTWAESDGTVKLKGANHTDNLASRPLHTIGYGQDPDVALTISSAAHYSYHVYYNSTNDKLICKKLNAIVPTGTSPTVIDTFILDSNIIVTAPPRIDAFNRLPGSDDLEWIVVAEVQNGSYSEIREYRGGPCGVYMTNYSTIPVNNGTTTAVANNPLYNNNGYSPCVAAGNGPDTYADPTSLGNSNYTLGWWIEGSQYNSLTVGAASFLPASAGYARVNTNTVASNVVTSGQCKLALSNGNNDGVGIAAAWAADTPTGPMIVIKASNSLAFKPSHINSTTGIEDLLIYPNPTSDQIYVRGRLNQFYTISNTAGVIFTRGAVNTGGIDVRALTSGVYFIKVQDQAGHVSHARFVKY